MMTNSELSDLPLTAQLRREAFAHFGRAMYYAQCLEQQLELMLASMYNRQFFEVPPEDRDAFYDRELKKTLGQRVKDIQKRTNVPPALKQRLEKAVDIRNRLAHKYFYERSRHIHLIEGMEEMISELQDMIEFFDELDQEFTELCVKFMKNNFGISKEHIEAETARFIRDGNKKGQNHPRSSLRSLR